MLIISLTLRRKAGREEKKFASLFIPYALIATITALCYDRTGSDLFGRVDAMDRSLTRDEQEQEIVFSPDRSHTREPR